MSIIPKIGVLIDDIFYQFLVVMHDCGIDVGIVFVNVIIFLFLIYSNS